MKNDISLVKLDWGLFVRRMYIHINDALFYRGLFG